MIFYQMCTDEEVAVLSVFLKSNNLSRYKIPKKYNTGTTNNLKIEKFLSDKIHPKQVTVPYLKLIQGKYSDAESDFKTYKLCCGAVTSGAKIILALEPELERNRYYLFDKYFLVSL